MASVCLGTLACLWVAVVSYGGPVGAGHTGDIPRDMVLVPAGPFVFGETQREPVNLCKRDFFIAETKEQTGAFYIDRFEVTNAQYAAFVKATGHRWPSHWHGTEPPAEIRDLPVTFVSHDDASAYATWAGKRLPTETEWEKAARGTDGRRFPWGNTQPTTAHGVFFRFWGEGPQPVGRCTEGASPYGCHDLAGNVCEWTSTSVKGTDEKIVRGGDWANVPENLRASRRTVALGDIRSGDLGFRCAADTLPKGARARMQGATTRPAEPPPDPHARLRRPPQGVHPRLFFTPADLPQIKRHIVASEVAARSWSWLQGECEKAWAENGSAKAYCEAVLDKGDRQAKPPPNLDPFSFTAFRHLLTDDAQNAARARRVALALGAQARSAQEPVYYLIAHLALVYDFTFGLLSEQERALVREGLVNQCTLMARLAKVSFFGLGRPSYYRAFDWCPLFTAPVGMAALAMEGEIDEATRLTWERMAAGAAQDYLQVGIGRDGSCLDGMAYFGFGHWYTGYLLDGLKLRGMDLYRHPHLIKMPNWLAHEVLPWRHEFNTIGKTHLRPPVGLFMAALHHAYPDSKPMRWAWHNHSAHRTYTCIPTIVYGDPMPAADTKGFPLAMHFRDRGLVIARTGWTTDAVMFATRYGREVHCQADTGSFTLCGYGSFFVIDPGQETRLSEGHCITRIDGKSTGSDFSSTEGTIRDYRHSPFATLVHGDASDAYAHYYPFKAAEGRKVLSIPVKEADRYFALVTGPGAPPYLMVRERLDKDGQPHAYQWLLQLSPGAHVDVAGSTATVSSPLHNERRSPSETRTRNRLAVRFFGTPPVTITTDTFGKKPGDYGPHPRLKAVRRAVNADFTVLLYPHTQAMPHADVTEQQVAGGLYVRIGWPTCTDHWLFAEPGKHAHAGELSSDGLMAMLRQRDGKVTGFLGLGGTRLRWRGQSVSQSREPTGFLSGTSAR